MIWLEMLPILVGFALGCLLGRGLSRLELSRQLQPYAPIGTTPPTETVDAPSWSSSS